MNPFSKMKNKEALAQQIQVSLVWTLGLCLLFWFLAPMDKLSYRLSNALTLGSLPGLALWAFRIARRWGFGDSFLYGTQRMRQVLKKDKLERKAEKGRLDEQDLQEARELEKKELPRDYHSYLMQKEDPKPVLGLFLVNVTFFLAGLLLAAV